MRVLILFFVSLAGAAPVAAQPCLEPLPLTTTPFWGAQGTMFADVNGDQLADAVAFNDHTNGGGSPGAKFVVRFAIPGQQRFDTTYQEISSLTWNESYDRGTFMVDVNADGLADAVMVYSWKGVVVRVNPGTLPFTAPANWTTTAFVGGVGTFMADVDDDDRADLIAVNGTNIKVRRSTGTGFNSEETWSTFKTISQPEHGWFFADVTGDGRADAIAVKANNIWVRASTGTGFGAAVAWTPGAFHGAHGTFFADVTGDGRADAIVSNATSIVVRRSTATAFGADEVWLSIGPFYGSATWSLHKTAFAPVMMPGYADLILVQDNQLQGRRNGWYKFDVPYCL